MRLRTILSHALDFAYPGTCAVCDATCEGGAVLCSDCSTNLTTLADAPGCEHCAMPLPSAGSPCPHCMGAGMPPFDRIVRLGVFEDPIKHLVHQMKYHRKWPLGELLADRLLDTERAKGLLTETDVLVPVPLHVYRHVLRGYNQADVIARRLGRRCGIPVVHAVRRTRNTETQTHLSQSDRLKNVRGAFALRPSQAKKLRGRTVAVVDDVMTIAATIREVARTLKHAEPATLVAIVVAVADPRRKGFQAI